MGSLETWLFLWSQSSRDMARSTVSSERAGEKMKGEKGERGLSERSRQRNIKEAWKGYAQQRCKGTDCCTLSTLVQRGYWKRCFCCSSELNRCKRQCCSPGSAECCHHAYCLLSQHSSTCTLCTKNRNLSQLKHACLKGLFCKYQPVGGRSLSGPAEVMLSKGQPCWRGTKVCLLLLKKMSSRARGWLAPWPSCTSAGEAMENSTKNNKTKQGLALEMGLKAREEQRQGLHGEWGLWRLTNTARASSETWAEKRPSGRDLGDCEGMQRDGLCLPGCVCLRKSRVRVSFSPSHHHKRRSQSSGCRRALKSVTAVRKHLSL